MVYQGFNLRDLAKSRQFNLMTVKVMDSPATPFWAEQPWNWSVPAVKSLIISMIIIISNIITMVMIMIIMIIITIIMIMVMFIRNRHGHQHDHIHHSRHWNEPYHDDHRPYDHQIHHDHGRLVHGELVHECVRPPKPLKRKGRRKSGQKRFRSLIWENYTLGVRCSDFGRFSS